MSEKPILEDGWTLAASEIAALFRAVRNGSQAPDMLLAVEMVIQGVAFIHGLTAEAVRRDMTAEWARQNLNLAFMDAQGTA